MTTSLSYPTHHTRPRSVISMGISLDGTRGFNMQHPISGKSPMVNSQAGFPSLFSFSLCRWLLTTRESGQLSPTVASWKWQTSILVRNQGRWIVIPAMVSTSLGVFMTGLPCLFFSGGGGTQNVRRSSRANKGNRGQLSQLQTIERIQTERTAVSKSHASQLERATANEPVNPMAPAKLKPRIKTSTTRVPDSDGQSELELVCNNSPCFGSKY